MDRKKRVQEMGEAMFGAFVLIVVFLGLSLIAGLVLFVWRIALSI